MNTHQAVVNSAGMIAPAVSLALSLPEKVTVIAGVLGSIYYLMLMSDWLWKKYQIWKASHVARSS